VIVGEPSVADNYLRSFVPLPGNLGALLLRHRRRTSCGLVSDQSSGGAANVNLEHEMEFLAPSGWRVEPNHAVAPQQAPATGCRT